MVNTPTKQQGRSLAWLGLASRFEFRLLVVLQILALVFLVYLDIQNGGSWDVLPSLWSGYKSELIFDWDLVKRRFWIGRNENWLALCCLTMPFFVAWSIGWLRLALDDRE